MKRWIFISCVLVIMAVLAAFYISSSQTNQTSNTTMVKEYKPVLYLALGDSACVGVGSHNGNEGYAARLFTYMKNENPLSQMATACMSGARSEHVVREQLKTLTKIKPTLVTISIGANDVTNLVDIEHFTRNFDEIITRLQRNTDATLIVMNIPDISLAPVIPASLRPLAQGRVIAFNKRIDEIARRHNLEVVDLYGKSREFSLHHEFFSQDGYHPSDAGYDFWAKELWFYVEKAIKN